MTRELNSAADQPANPARAALFAAIAATAAASALPSRAQAATLNVSDQDILNFALNLEYLEGEYYARGVFGTTLDQALKANLGAPVRGGRRVNLANGVRRGFLEDIARDEIAHVALLRSVLGDKAIRRPAIDIDAGFQGVARAAGLSGFDPFASEENFFLGAFLFEDVGVTAYKGAAYLISDGEILTNAAQILAAEAYHAGVIRSVLYKMGGKAITASTAISQLRDQLDGPGELDQPIVMNGRANLVPANQNGIAFSRTPQHVHNIVYATPAQGVTRGGFFPEGTNGRLTTS